MGKSPEYSDFAQLEKIFQKNDGKPSRNEKNDLKMIESLVLQILFDDL